MASRVRSRSRSRRRVCSRASAIRARCSRRSSSTRLPGPTRDGIRRAIPLLRAEHYTVAAELGNGSRVLASDTVPFAIWCAATHLDDFAGACWSCVEVGGDIDTTCAMAGGIIVGATGIAGIPDDWLTSREPLPI